MVETSTNKKTSIAVKPYFDSSVSNMGLESYGLSLFDGVTHTEQLACIEKNGVVQYLTGLNEFSPEIRLMKNPEERDGKCTKDIWRVIERDR